MPGRLSQSKMAAVRKRYWLERRRTTSHHTPQTRDDAFCPRFLPFPTSRSTTTMFHSTSSRSSLGHNQPNRSHSHSSSHSHASGGLSYSQSQSRPAYRHATPQPPPPQQQQRPAYNDRPRPDYPVTQTELWRVFNEVDADHSGSISVMELQRALKNGTLLAILGYTEQSLKTGNATEDWQRMLLVCYIRALQSSNRRHPSTF